MGRTAQYIVAVHGGERCVSQEGVVQAPQSTDDARRSKARCKLAKIGLAEKQSTSLRSRRDVVGDASSTVFDLSVVG